MTSDDPLALDATAQAQLIRSGQLSVRELVAATLAAIDRLDPTLNAYRVVLAEQALDDAEQLDQVRPEARLPLHGVSIAIKDDTGENGVARAIRDAIKAQAGDRFKAETDDGEDVLISKRGHQPDFEIAVVSNTVKGVRVSRDRE